LPQVRHFVEDPPSYLEDWADHPRVPAIFLGGDQGGLPAAGRGSNRGSLFLTTINYQLKTINYKLSALPYSLLPIPFFTFSLPHFLTALKSLLHFAPIPYSLFPIPYFLFPIPYCLFPVRSLLSVLSALSVEKHLLLFKRKYSLSHLCKSYSFCVNQPACCRQVCQSSISFRVLNRLNTRPYFERKVSAR